MYIVFFRIRTLQIFLDYGYILFLYVVSQQDDEDIPLIKFSAAGKDFFQNGQKLFPMLFDTVRLETIAQRPIIDERNTSVEIAHKYFVGL